MREALRKTANTALLIGGVLYLGYFAAQAVFIGYGSSVMTPTNLSTIQGYLVGSLSSLLESFSGFAFAIGAILKLLVRNLKDVAEPQASESMNTPKVNTP